MKKVLLSVIVAVLLSAVAIAQPAQCRVNATIYKPSGATDGNFTITVFRVVFAGSVYSNQRQVFRTNSSGVLLGADNAAGVSLPQGSVVWIYANAPGFDFNPNSGTAFQIPNTSTAQLTALASATTVFRALGDLVYGGVDGIPTRLPAGINGRCLVMVSGIPAWTVCPGGGGGGSSIWGNITGTLADQADLQTALNLKANTSALAAVALSGAYNDLTGQPTLGTAAALNVAASGNAASGEIVKGDDTRLSDARTPTSHTHPSTDISDSTAAGRTLLTDVDATAQRASLGLGTAAVLNVAASGNAASGEVVKGDDTRLSDARTPTAHTHAAADTVSGIFDAARIPDLSAIYSVLAHTHTFTSLTSKPTTLSGYGITDAQPLDQDLTDIAALTGNGLLRKSGGVWAMDSATYLTGNQTITLSGDLSGSGATAISATIGNNTVSDGKIRQSAGLSLLGRSTNSTGNIADITAANDGEVLRRSGTSIGFGTIATAGIGASQVTNAKLAQVGTATFKGRTTAGTGDPEDLTAAQATALLNAFVGDSGSGGTKGLVPAPVTGDATKFLRGDGVFAAVSGSGDVVGPSSAADNEIPRFDSTTGKLIQASGVTLSDLASNAYTFLASTPTQGASAIAGSGFNLTASPAIAGNTNAGAAVGGSINFTGGNAARLTSGNANGGSIILTGGSGIGTGGPGQVLIAALSTSVVNGGLAIGGTTTGFYHSGNSYLFVDVSGTNSAGWRATHQWIVGYLGFGSNAPDNSFARSAAGVIRVGQGATSATAAGSLLIAPSTATVTGNLAVIPDNAVTNAVFDVARFGGNSTGTAAAGFGGRLSFSAETSTTNDSLAAALEWNWTTATHASRTAAIDIRDIYNAGSLSTLARFTEGRFSLMRAADANPTTTELTSLGAASFYVKNSKLVFAYNNAGTITYVTIPLDGSTTTWTHSTTAP